MRRMRRLSRHQKVLLKRIGYSAAIAALIVGAVIFVFVIVVAHGLPSEEAISNLQIADSTKIYDRTGNVLLYEVAEDKKRTVIPFDQIPQHLKDATISIEDERFYSQPGLDWRGIARAIYANVVHGRIVQGGSTITQQLAKNAFLSPERTVTRKVREVLLAVKLNRYYTKDQIVTLYLNEIPYGPTIYGVESASQAYFGKPVHELTIAESALLAALPKAPSYYSPWGSHVDELIGRQHLVLRKMHDLGKITDEQLAEAERAPITFKPRFHGIKAPHFSLMVEEYLVEKYGEEVVLKGGLKVITTIDAAMQEAAEKAVFEGAARNDRLYGGKNAALVAQDPKTGQILAYVGSRDYFDIENQGNFNVPVQGKRQPGSALKPFIYMAAFQKGYVPQSVIFDVPTEFAALNSQCPAVVDLKNTNKECFHPENFDGTFRGPVTLKEALAHSVNVPAVKMLYLVGLKDAIAVTQLLGLATLNDPDRYGLSLVLGGGEVRLIDLVGAYATLAQEGVRHDPATILEVRDNRGNVLESYEDTGTRVIDAHFPRLINNILSDVGLRSGLFQSSLSLTTFDGYDIALKTGTTNDYRDAWVIGYTQSIVGGVWAGNNDNTPMRRQGTSILAAVPIWNAFMAEAIRKFPQGESFPDEQSESPDKPMLNGEYVVNGTVHSILQYVNKSDPLGPAPDRPEQDSQYRNWEASVNTWALGNPDSIIPPEEIATSSATIVSILSPEAGSDAKENIRVRAIITASESDLLASVQAFWNGALVKEMNAGLVNNFELSFSFTPDGIHEHNALRVVARTLSGAETAAEVSVVGKSE